MNVRNGLCGLPKRSCLHSISEVQRCRSAAAVRSFFLPPINHCDAVAVLAIQAGSNVSSGRAGRRRHPAAAIGSFPEQSREWSRNSNCVSPGATDATMSGRVSLCYGSASELSRSISDASMPDPENSTPTDGPSAENVSPLSQFQIVAQDEWQLFNPSLTMTSEPKP